MRETHLSVAIRLRRLVPGNFLEATVKVPVARQAWVRAQVVVSALPVRQRATLSGSGGTSRAGVASVGSATSLEPPYRAMSQRIQRAPWYRWSLGGINHREEYAEVSSSFAGRPRSSSRAGVLIGVADRATAADCDFNT